LSSGQLSALARDRTSASFTCVYIYTHAQRRTHAYVHSYAHAHTCTQIHTRNTHSDIQAHTHSDADTHALTLVAWYLLVCWRVDTRASRFARSLSVTPEASPSSLANSRIWWWGA
jgi:hypothetical protein